MTVREQLKAEDPFLHESLERSWRIAHETWLPTIPTSLGSHNAYPHLHNMEMRLNDLADAFGGDEQRPSFRLSPVEKYLLLAAILFHDIGRGSEEHRKTDHAFGSYDLLVGEAEPDDPEAGLWARYGIPDYGLARVIAKLALHHADPTDRAGEEIRKASALSERTIDPFGRVRENGLLAALVLLDQLDTSYRRVIPPEMGTGAKAFRIRVQGVQLDPEARLVRSVVAGFEGKAAKRYGVKATLEGDRGNGAQPSARVELRRELEHFASAGRSYEQWRADEALDYAEKSHIPLTSEAKDYIQIVQQSPGSFAAAKVASKLQNFADEQKAAMLEAVEAIALIRAVAEGKGQFPPRRPSGQENGPPPERELTESEKLAVLQGDLHANTARLRRYHTDLYRMGITLDLWFLELDEHLFTQTGHETWEPIFDAPYLQRVADEMWSLSARVFGRTVFSYDTLAAALRDPDTARVKRAVRRLDILTRDMPPEPCGGRGRCDLAQAGALEADDLRWQWRVGTGDWEDGCCCVKIRRVRDLLDGLASAQHRTGNAP